MALTVRDDQFLGKVPVFNELLRADFTAKWQYILFLMLGIKRKFLVKKFF